MPIAGFPIMWGERFLKEFVYVNDERVEIHLEGGTSLMTNFVVLSIGVRPDTGFLSGSGIQQVFGLMAASTGKNDRTLEEMPIWRHSRNGCRRINDLMVIPRYNIFIRPY